MLERIPTTSDPNTVRNSCRTISMVVDTLDPAFLIVFSLILTGWIGRNAKPLSCSIPLSLTICMNHVRNNSDRITSVLVNILGDET